MPELKDLIRTQRAKCGRTLEEIAKDVGVSKATVQRWESGEIKDMRRDKLVLLAKALRTTPAYLMGWVESGTEHDAPTRESVTTMLEKMLHDAGYLRSDEPLTPELLSTISVALQTAIELYRKQHQ